MAIFAVIRQPGLNSEKLAAAVTSAYPNHYDLGNGVWLVAERTTAQEISNKLQILPEPTNGSAVILEAASYFGRANPAIWSWMKSNWEATASG